MERKFQMIKLNKHHILLAVSIIVILFIVTEVYQDQLMQTNGMPLTGKTVLIDAGHGGMDPGQPGINGMHEAEINLMITTKLKSYLESSGCYVILTRTDENGLYDENSTSKKKDDMARRKALLENANSTIAISIHQNSFTDAKYKGAQVFFPKDHEDSMKLAEKIQTSLRENLDKENKREIKTEKYYILQNPTIPIVICECGFLTNYEDSKNLNNELYQEKVAWAIYCGICDYFLDA